MRKKFECLYYSVHLQGIKMERKNQDIESLNGEKGILQME